MKLALFVHVSDRAWEAARDFRDQEREGAGDVAIRLGYEKRAADLEAFVENTGNHSAAPGRHGRRGQRLRPAAAGGVSQSARLLRPVLPGPALRSSASRALRPLPPWPLGAVPAQGSLSPAAGSSPVSDPAFL